MRQLNLQILLLSALVLASCSHDPAAQVRRYVENGDKFFAKTRYKEASIMYRRALQVDMRSGEAWYRLGLTSLKLGAFGEAIRDLRRTVELQPNNATAVIKLADLELLASMQDPKHSTALVKEVKEFSQQMLVTDPNSYDGHRLQGQVALLGGNAVEAVNELKKANTVRSLQYDLVTAYFRALVDNNQFQDAENLAHEMIAKDKTYAPMYDLLFTEYKQRNKPDDAEGILKLKSGNNPQNAQFVAELAEYYYQLGRRSDTDAMLRHLTSQKEFKQGRLLAGDFYFHAGEFERAREQYEAAIQAFPQDKRVYQKRLVQMFASQPGKSGQAGALLAAVLKDNPRDDEAIALGAALALSTGDHQQIDRAAKDLTALVTRTPRSYLLRYNLARAFESKGDLDLARLQLEEVNKLRPGFVPALMLLAKVYIEKGDAPLALKVADQIIAFDKGNLQAHLVRSSALMTLNDKDKSREELAYLTKNFPQNADVQYQTGYVAYGDKDFQKAERIFDELYKANPGSQRALAGLTEALAAENRMDDALKKVKAAIEREPDRRDLKLVLASLDMRSRQFDQAIGIYRSLLAQEPKAVELQAQLGEAQWRKGDADGAVDTLKRCSQEVPDNPNCLRLLGRLLKETGKHDQAKLVYEQILKAQPDDAGTLNDLARIKTEDGVELDQALALAQRARQKVPASHEFADTVALIYIRTGQGEAATSIYRSLLEKEPRNATFHYHYGLALMGKGDKAAARKEMRTALENLPSKDEEAKIRALLQ